MLRLYRKKMEKRLRPKKYVIACLYVALFTSVMLGTFFVTKSMKNKTNSENVHIENSYKMLYNIVGIF